MSVRTAHSIITLGGPLHRYPEVGRCIYCGHVPPGVQLSDEHIIADGLGGDLLLPSASCPECARITCRYEQQFMRDFLRQPRGALGMRSRKRKPKQTHIRMRIGPDENIVEKDVPFSPDMPAYFLFFTTDRLPGILRGAPLQEECIAYAYFFSNENFSEQSKLAMGGDRVRWGSRMHLGVFSQVIAKTAHAFAIATLGVDNFKPVLNDHILAYEPPFPGYYMGSLPSTMACEAMHEISLTCVRSPWPTVIGTGWRDIYVVRLRLFAKLGAPEFIVAVGLAIN